VPFQTRRSTDRSNSFVRYFGAVLHASRGLDDVAFLNPDGTRVLVVYNNSPRWLRLRWTRLIRHAFHHHRGESDRYARVALRERRAGQVETR
jgi:hypothetical protein